MMLYIYYIYLPRGLVGAHLVFMATGIVFGVGKSAVHCIKIANVGFLCVCMLNNHVARQRSAGLILMSD